jgi:hypothetical protein
VVSGGAQYLLYLGMWYKQQRLGHSVM